jgi:magnesium chelatase family protein
MLARRLPSILPPLSFAEALEAAKVYSVAGLLSKGEVMVRERPFRSPHHTISDAGLIGGGQTPKPGEISLAHQGVLFLDELPEFRKNVLEALRQPLEEGTVTIARSAMTVTYPARFLFVAAMNPCPCGYYGAANRSCRCSSQQIRQYQGRISGPLLDRIDLHIEVPALRYRELTGRYQGEASGSIRERIGAARTIQQTRFGARLAPFNARMTDGEIKRHCEIDRDSQKLLEMAMEKLGLSARAYKRILKVSRTIADLDGHVSIQSPHVAEAIQYRSLDRKLL